MDHHWQAYSLVTRVFLEKKQDLTGIFCHLPWLINSNSEKKTGHSICFLPFSPNKKQTTLAETPKAQRPSNPWTPSTIQLEGWLLIFRSNERKNRLKTGKPPSKTDKNKSLEKYKDGIPFWDWVLTTSKQKASIFWPPSHVPLFQPQCRRGHRHFVFQIHPNNLHLLYCQEHGSHHPRAKAQVEDWCRWSGYPEVISRSWKLPHSTFTFPVSQIRKRKTPCNNPTYLRNLRVLNQKKIPHHHQYWKQKEITQPFFFNAFNTNFVEFCQGQQKKRTSPVPATSWPQIRQQALQCRDLNAPDFGQSTL